MSHFLKGGDGVNLIDRIVGWFSPEAGAQREAWRQVLQEYRNYDAGSHGRANANWRVFNQSAEYTDRYSRDTVRARARDLERNSDMANSVIGPFVRNIVGKGLVLQAETGNDTLNKEIEKLWKVWCKKRNCDVTGTQSLNQMLRMAVRRKKVDGGILFVKRYTSGGVLPFKLQLFEVDELDASQIAPKHKGNRVIGGIEYDRFNAPVGYWIRQYTLDGMTSTEPVYLKASDVIFYFSKRRPSQLREMSDMSQTVTRIRDANEFMTAVSMKQRIEACFGIGIKRALPQSGVGRMGTSGPKLTYEGKMLTPGMIMEMNPGDEIQQINPQGQASDAAGFVKLLQRMIGAGQGISYEATSRDMSQSTYSSARQGLIEDSIDWVTVLAGLTAQLQQILELLRVKAACSAGPVHPAAVVVLNQDTQQDASVIIGFGDPAALRHLPPAVQQLLQRPAGPAAHQVRPGRQCDNGESGRNIVQFSVHRYALQRVFHQGLPASKLLVAVNPGPQVLQVALSGVGVRQEAGIPDIRAAAGGYIRPQQQPGSVIGRQIRIIGQAVGVQALSGVVPELDDVLAVGLVEAVDPVPQAAVCEDRPADQLDLSCVGIHAGRGEDGQPQVPCILQRQGRQLPAVQGGEAHRTPCQPRIPPVQQPGRFGFRFPGV